MKTKKISTILLILLASVSVLWLAACNKPTGTVTAPGEAAPAGAPAAASADAEPADSAVTDQGGQPYPAPAGAEPAPAGPAPEDAAIFIEHTTIPTGTVLGPGQIFTKTWLISNSGTTTWNPEYDLVFYRDEQMSGPNEQPLFAYHRPIPTEIAPGKPLTVTVVLTSPQAEGEYQGYWMLRNANNAFFGIGNQAKDPLLVDIIVKAGATLGTSSDPNAGSNTGSGNVENVTLTVTPAEYVGDCPVQLVFSGAIEVDGLGPYEYEYTYDVNTDLPGWEYLIPPPNQFSYDSPGWHVYQTSFVINIPADADGWMRLEGSGPGSSSYSQVYYNVDCNE